jgi:hypothetical protein
MKAAKPAWLLWLTTSVCWVLVVFSWDGLARDPGIWSSYCTSVGGALATLLVLVLTLAPPLMQLASRHSVGVAVRVLDAGSLAYVLFFSSGVLVAYLTAAAPSRFGTLLTIACAMPIVMSLVPVMVTFMTRIQSDWPVRQPVDRAVTLLNRRARRRNRHGRRGPSQDRVGQACNRAAHTIHQVLAHAHGAPEDLTAARTQTLRLLRALVAQDGQANRESAKRVLESLVRLAAEQGVASLRREVAWILAETAAGARPETGRELITTAFQGLCTLGVETDATPSERAEFAELAATIGVRGIRRTAARAHPTDLRCREDQRTDPGITPVASREPWLRRVTPMESDGFSCEATSAVLTLLGPPNRPHDDSRDAQRELRAFERGCELLQEMVTVPLDQLLDLSWVPAQAPLDALEGWLSHRLGPDDGDDRLGDLIPKSAQPTPYAREFEAAAAAVTKIATVAYERNFDHVAQPAMAVLARATARAARKNRTAFVLYALCLGEVQDALFTGFNAPRTVADCLRTDEFLTSLQSENHTLLQALIDTYSGENAFTHHEPRAPDLFRQARRSALTWALRPRSWVVDGFGSLELEVARTAQSLRVPHRQPADSEDRAEPEKNRVPLERVDLGPFRTLELDPHVALAQAVAAPDSDHPGVAVLGAALRWRDALDIAEGRLTGWRQDGTVRVGTLSTPRHASPQARAFQQRIQAWEETPWCRNHRNWAGHHLVSEARHLTVVPVRDDPLAEDLRLLLLHWQAHRGRRIVQAGLGDRPAEQLQKAGILWGSWPPAPGCPDDPMEGSDWALAKRVDHRLDEGNWPRGRPSRLPDRIYHARLTGKDRIIAAEPDGSHRVVRGHATGDPYLSLVYGGSGLEYLARRLVLDVLGPLALCPACWGGSVREGDAPGWCETCRGDGRHADLHRAQSAVAHAVNGREIEWDISRSELLDAIVSADR